MSTYIDSVEGSWLCGKQIKSTCQEGVFEWIDPKCCNEKKSLYDLCDIPICVPNSILVSPESCANGDCNNMQRRIKFADIADLLGLGDIKVGATPEDKKGGALSEKLKLCQSLLLSGIISLIPKKSGDNEYLELCFDRTKLNIKDKLSELIDGPLSLGTCGPIVINGNNFDAKPVLQGGGQKWEWKCPRRKGIAHIFINGIPPIINIPGYTFSYPLTEHYQYIEYASRNVPNMNTAVAGFGKCILIDNSGFYEIESKLAYHIDQYVSAVKLEVIKVSGGVTTILSDKDGGFACSKDEIDSPPTDIITTTGTKTRRFDLNPPINAHKISATVRLNAGDILTFRGRIDTSFCDTTYAAGKTGSILVGPSSVYTTDVSLNSSFLTVKERDPITYF